jgi:hypothetical protein
MDKEYFLFLFIFTLIFLPLQYSLFSLNSFTTILLSDSNPIFLILTGVVFGKPEKPRVIYATECAHWAIDTTESHHHPDPTHAT